MYQPYSSMSPEDRYEAQVKEFGLFFLGVGVGVFCTIILFIYGCFSKTCISRKSTQTPDPSTSIPNPEPIENPPPYSSLRFDKKCCIKKCCLKKCCSKTLPI